MLKSARNSIKNQTKDVLGIWDKVKRRDFSGNTGLAIKNSIYQTSTTIISKVGSLIFTILIARMLLPELFGLYSLALSTIVFISSFADLGIGTTLIRYVARKKNIRDAGPYVFYLRRLKMTLSLVISLILICTAYFISNNYYQKPIFFALLFGSLYIMANSFLMFVTGVFQAENNFKYPLYKEIFLQVTRLLVVPLVILLTLKYSSETLVASIIVALSLCYFVSSFFLYINMKKYRQADLSKDQKKEILKFTLPLTFTVLSGIFFGYIDMIMLGRFVSAEYIAYYQTALALLGSGMAVLSFSGALFPIFSRLDAKKLEIGLKKSLKMSLLISIFAIVIAILISDIAVRLIYGIEYIPASTIIKTLSLIVIFDPLIAVYSNYYISLGKNNFVAKVVIFATILNIILNYVLITLFLKQSMMLAVLGAAIATVISRGAYFVILAVSKKRVHKTT